ncbi:MAG: hypothetical protein ACOY4L_12840, partial [Pseudomonadota bacterium]
MQVQHIGQRIRGFYRVAPLGHLWDMIPRDAQRRLDILRFWDKHGLAAILDAFGVSRRTLYAYRRGLRQKAAIPQLWPPAHARPKGHGSRGPTPRLVAEIRHLRTRYPKLGKDKRHVLLHPWCEAMGVRLPSAASLPGRPT